MATGDRIYLADKETLDKNIERIDRLHDNEISREVSGTLIAMDNCSNVGLKNLKLFGKTTQDGEPTPDNPVPLVSVGDGGAINTMVTGKNLLPKFTARTINGVEITVDDDGTVHLNGTASESTNVKIDFIVPTNIPLTLCSFATGTWPDSNQPRLAIYSQITATTLAISNKGNAKTVATETFAYGNVEYRIRLSSGFTYNNCTMKPMLVVGEYTSVNMAAYEPYKAQTLTAQTPNGLPGIPVTSGGNYTDANGQQWICDEIDFARGVYVKRIDNWVINGSEDFVINGDSVRIIPAKRIAYKFVLDMKTMCNSFKEHGRGYSSLADVNAFLLDGEFTHFYSSATTSTRVFFFKNSAFTDVDTAKAWFTAHHTEILFPLAEPIETPLDETEKAAYAALHSNKPTTTVYNDSGAGMAVEYIADTKTYVDTAVKRVADVTHKLYGNSIIEEVSGEVITVSDSSDLELAQLKLFGKTTQDGEPAPDAPVPLVSVGDGGSIAVKIGVSLEDAAPQTLIAQTPNGLPGIPVTSGGNYTDASGQQWVCDEVDFARGVYVQRVKRYTFDGDEEWTGLDSPTRSFALKLMALNEGVGSCVLCDKLAFNGELTAAAVHAVGIRSINSTARDGFCIYLRLPEEYTGVISSTLFKTWLAENPLDVMIALTTPIETPLSADEIAAFKALHTNRPNATVYNDSGAGMEIEYIADTKLYIDKKFAELAAAIVNNNE